MINLNELINNPELFNQIKENDIDELSKQLIPIFEDKINNTADFLTKKLMATPGSSSKDAFKLQIEDVIKKSVYSYVANQKFKINVPLNAYLNKSIYIFSKILIENNENGNDKIKVHICPHCRDRGIKEFLTKTEDVLYCKNCNNEANNSSITEEERQLYRAFSEHSIDGCCCPACQKFIPNSLKKDDILLCPYCKSDCFNAEHAKNPTSTISRVFVSINNIMKPNNSNVDTGHKSTEFSEQYCDGTDNACENLIKEEEFKKKFLSIKEIISLQKTTNQNVRRFPNKKCMYESFDNTLDKYPEEMINYLTIGGQNSELSIQATIFQEFAKLMKEELPIKMYLNGNEINIIEPTDSRLNLFSDIREFSNFIDNNSVAKKRIGFKYENDNKIEDPSEMFIGELISITNIAGEDLLSFVDNYNFTSVRFKYTEKTKPGMDVIVKYYSILPSYSLKSLIHLQRIKKKISDSINSKISVLPLMPQRG